MAKDSEFTDKQILTMLDLRDHEGWTAKAIGERFGVSKGTIIGLFDRIRKKEQPDACLKAENRNGGMPRKWWKR